MRAAGSLAPRGLDAQRVEPERVVASPVAIMTAAAWSSALAPTPLPSPSGRTRLRPGDRPVWVDVARHAEHFDAWRVEAAGAGLRLDVWAALLLELSIVLADLHDLGVRAPEALLAAELARPNAARLAPTPELRRWLDELDDGGPGDDELPELVLPARVLARHAPRTPLVAHLRAERLELARQAERAAALRGLTLEVWGLRAALTAGASRR